MPFSHNSRNFQLLQGSILHALCECSSTSGYVNSNIDLNLFIGNDAGHFEFGGSHFLDTSTHVHLDGTILSGTLFDGGNTYRNSYIDLDQCIDNIGGVLTMAHPSSLEEARSSLGSRSQAWKKKIPSVNFQLFNYGDADAIPDSYIVKLKRDSNMTGHIEQLQKEMPPSPVDSEPSFELKFRSQIVNEYAANFTGEGLLRVATCSDVEIISSDTKGRGGVVTANGSWRLQATEPHSRPTPKPQVKPTNSTLP